MPFDLAFIWAGLIAFAVLAYVILDGFDLGIGIVFPLLPSEDARDQAMNTVESDAPANSIVSVFQKGYELNERLVRPALVSVAKPKET